MPLVALAATRPLVALIVFAVVVAVARTVGCAVDALHTRRESRGGATRADSWVVLGLLPWHAFRGAAGAVLQVPVGGVGGMLVAGLGYWAFGTDRIMVWQSPETMGLTSGATNRPYVFSAVLVVAALVAFTLAWFGPAGHTGRRGARVALRYVAPSWAGAVAAVCLGVIAVVVILSPFVTGQPAIDWWPMSGAPGS